MLGRLECAAEPRLIYFKAYCHSITASFNQDPLTGRTGTEEALSSLQAASAQPWAPLDPESYRILAAIADITPTRVYYPEEMRALQKITWSEAVTTASQDDSFRPVVEDILRQCAALHRFHLNSGEAPVYLREGNSHLLRRAASRNQTLQPIQGRKPSVFAVDVQYQARDSLKSSGFKQAFEAAFLVWQWSRNMDVNLDLAARLQEW